MSKVPTKTRKSDLGPAGSSRRWLAVAPKGLLIAAVILADLAFNGGLLLTRQKVKDVGPASTTGLSCDSAGCQRQTAKAGANAGVNVPMGKPRLLEFTSAHCPSCEKMAPLVRKMERECTAHDGTLLPVDVDTDAGDSLATRYGVHALPTFIMIDANGEELARLVGEQPRERLTVALADVNGVLCTVL